MKNVHIISIVKNVHNIAKDSHNITRNVRIIIKSVPTKQKMVIIRVYDSLLWFRQHHVTYYQRRLCNQTNN